MKNEKKILDFKKTRFNQQVFEVFFDYLCGLQVFEFLFKIVEEPISEFLHMSEHFLQGDHYNKNEIKQQKRPENWQIQQSGKSAGNRDKNSQSDHLPIYINEISFSFSSNFSSFYQYLNSETERIKGLYSSFFKSSLLCKKSMKINENP